MSTLKATNIKNDSSASNNIVLDSSGGVVVSGVTTVSAGSASAPSITPIGDNNTGIFFPSADTIAFAEGGVESVRIDSSGRLLLGTTSTRTYAGVTPHIQLEGTSFNSSSISLTANSNDGNSAFLQFYKTRGTSIGSNTVVQSGDYLGALEFYGGDGSAPKSGASINVFVDGTPGTNDMPGRIVFSTTADGASSPTERARIDNSGRLLVGTSSARSNLYANTAAYTPKVQIESNTNTWGNGLSLINYSGSGYGPTLALGLSFTNTQGANALVQAGEICGKFQFLANDGTNFYPIAEIQGYTDGATSTGDVPGRLVFSTTADGASSPTERMTINSNGFVNIGAYGIPSSTPGMQLYGAGNLIFCKRSDTGEAISFFANSTTKVGNIVLGASSTTYNTSSDYRLKENVVPLAGATERLKQLPVHRFNFIVEPNKTVDGFLAHEAADVVPECVTGEKDAVDDDGNPIYQGIDQSKLVPLLTAALQEAVAKIESLEARLTAAGI